MVLWKPSDTALLSSYAVYKTLLEAGLPPSVVQFVPADGPVFGDTVTSSEHFCGLNFTGSVPYVGEGSGSGAKARSHWLRRCWVLVCRSFEHLGQPWQGGQQTTGHPYTV